MGMIAEHAPAKPLPLCPVGRLLIDPSLDDADLAALTDGLADVELSNAAIVRWLNECRVRFNKDTVAKHRAGDCRCTPAA